ncbi:endonuclease [Bacillus velezensis]|uniref:endonuclease n=1 Tax=Bacillus velezensis TaxID=492670 RepID=UPI00146EA4B5|nr:endonuclease [Bacillus velezensis]NMV98074.1 endonuclease [Bacillus velezensis]
MFKKIVIGSILVSSITGLSNTYASATSIDHSPKKVSTFATAQSGILLEEEKTFNGDGKFYFDYYGSEDGEIRVYVENTGSSPFDFRVVKPGGDDIASGYTVKPGRSTTLTFDVSHYKTGTYYIRCQSSDGSKIKAFAKVRGL